MSGPRPGVLFDLDGTLVDTNYLHTVAWARAFAEVGLWAPMHAIHRLVGMGGDQLVPKLHGTDVAAAHDAKDRHFAALIKEARAFPGAAALVRAVHGLGLVTVLATSSSVADLEPLLELLDIEGALDSRTTKDDVDRSKPEPDIFSVALERGGVDPRRALVVGDSVWDVEAARSAGLGCVAVESGGFSRHELAEAGAVHVYRDVQELGDQLLTSPLARLRA